MPSKRSQAPVGDIPRGRVCLDVSPKTAPPRVRQPITRSRGLVRGQFPSTKSGHMVAWESQLEEKACYLFEFCPAITSFRDQPLKIEYPFGGSIKNYYTDFELVLSNGQVCYVEIKPNQKLFHPENFDRFQNIAKTFAQNRQPFYVLTEQELPSKQRQRNLSILRTYLRHALPKHLIHEVEKWVSATSAPDFEALSNYVCSRAVALALMAQQKIALDLELPLSHNTAIFPAKELSHETSLFTCRTGPGFERRDVSINSYSWR